MNRKRSLRSRLDRLERSVGGEGQTASMTLEFPIDITLAKALRDDCMRVEQIRLAECEKRFGPVTPADIEEKRVLNERIAEGTKAVGSPPDNYGREYNKERERLEDLKHMREWPYFTRHLDHLEDTEEALLTARVRAFEASPEGRTRQRIHKLTWDRISNRLDAVGESELEDLEKLYPPLPLGPKQIRLNELAEPGLKAIEAELERREKEFEQERALKRRNKND
jgi:hypothetical protein